MPKRERDSYEADDVRVFDGGEDDDDKGDSNLPMVIVIALLVLAALGGLVWVSYNNGVARGHADVPARQLAQNSTTEAPATAPSSGEESPTARHIKVYQQPAGADEDAYQEITPNTGQTAKPTPPALRSAEAKPAPAKAVVPPPAAVTQATLPAAKPQTKTTAETAPATATAAPKQLAPAAPPAKAAPAPTAPVAATAATAGGAYVLQIGAYKSESEANGAWKVMQTKHAGLLSSLSSNVQKADLGDKGVWYRLRAGAFADKDAATAFCDKLKAVGGICFPAK